MAIKNWNAPRSIAREDMVATSDALLAQPDIPFVEKEDIFRLEALGLAWDIGVMTYTPQDESRIPTDLDGKKIGFFLLHGGSADFRFMAPLARLLTGKYGYKVVSMTYPGRLNFENPTREWPGDTISPDGVVRTPIWLRGETITPDQMDVIRDVSLRARYGTRINARAKPGTLFYDRMAAWPVAFEEAMKEACRRHLPPDSYSIFVHGHSTGGPFVHMLTQRVANIAGVVGMENSPFATIYQKMLDIDWPGPFTDLLIRTWRDVARYAGAEAYHQEGEKALMRLPWLMEDVFDEWEKSKSQPNFKAEYIMHYACTRELTASAHAVARRLKLDDNATAALVDRYIGYTREMSGPGVKPVPPILLSITKFSRDHRAEVYENVVLPSFAKMNPAPPVTLVRFEAGTHHYEHAEPDLPIGLVPSITALWHDAIRSGYFSRRS